MTATNSAKDNKVKRFCGGCGTPLQDGQQYCHVCGAANDWGADCAETTTASISVEEVTQPEYQPKQQNTDTEQDTAYLAASTPVDGKPVLAQAQPVQPMQEQGEATEDSKLLCPECQLPVQVSQSSCPVCFSELSWKEGRPVVPHVHDSDTAPVVDSWKTSISFSLLGLFVGVPLLIVISMILGIPLAYLATLQNPNLHVASFLSMITVWLISPILTIIYASKIYPSYFTRKPLLKSNKAISFANLMFGGLIFGCLWNSNLTNKVKGYSHIVFAVIASALILFCCVIAMPYHFRSSVIPPPMATQQVQQSEQTPTNLNVEPLERTEDANIHIDSRTGASFVIPNNWTEFERSTSTVIYTSDEDGFVEWSTWIVYTSGRAESSMDDYTVEEMLRSFQTAGDAQYEGAQKVSINGIDYFLMVGSMAIPQEGEDEKVEFVILLRIEQEFEYMFKYYIGRNATVEDAIFSDSEGNWQTFLSMVASMTYP